MFRSFQSHGQGHSRTSEMMLAVRIATNNRPRVSVVAGRIGKPYRRSCIGTETPLPRLSAASLLG